MEFVYLVTGCIYDGENIFFGVYTTIEMAYQVKAYKEEEYFEKFKKKYPTIVLNKEDFTLDVMMVPVNKTSDNKIGAYFE